MMNGGDITDKLQLPSECSCAQNLTYVTTRTDRNSYEKRYRVRRNCLQSADNKYTIESIAIDTAGTGYAVGDYVQLNYGSEPLLLYVSWVDSDGDNGILEVLPVNSPTFNSLPTNPLDAVTLSGSGQGAKITLTMVPSKAYCCNCTSD